MKTINSQNAPAPVGPYSHATVSDTNSKIIFLSGQIALNEDGILENENIEIETKQVLKNLKFVLDEAGLKKENILKAEIYLTDLADFSTVNKIYEDFMEDHKPARVTIGVASLPLGAKIEISLIAEK